MAGQRLTCRDLHLLQLERIGGRGEADDGALNAFGAMLNRHCGRVGLAARMSPTHSAHEPQPLTHACCIAALYINGSAPHWWRHECTLHRAAACTQLHPAPGCTLHPAASCAGLHPAHPAPGSCLGGWQAGRWRPCLLRRHTWTMECVVVVMGASHTVYRPTSGLPHPTPRSHEPCWLHGLET